MRLSGSDSRRRISVSDDGDSVRDIIGIFLEHAGFEVCGEAANGSNRTDKKVEARPDRVGFGDAPHERSGSCIHSQSNNAGRSDCSPYALSKRARFCIGSRCRYQGRSGQNRGTGQAGRERSFIATTRSYLRSGAQTQPIGHNGRLLLFNPVYLPNIASPEKARVTPGRSGESNRCPRKRGPSLMLARFDIFKMQDGTYVWKAAADSFELANRIQRPSAELGRRLVRKSPSGQARAE